MSSFGDSFGQAFGGAFGPVSPPVVVIHIKAGEEKSDDYKRRKDRLTSKLNLAYDKVFGIKQVETKAAVEKVLEDVQEMKAESFDYEGMLKDIERVEQRAKYLIQLAEEDELMLVMMI